MTELVDKQNPNIKHPGRRWDVLFRHSGGDIEINVQYEEDFER